MQFTWNKFERHVGSLKFAVFIISFFAFLMVLGTFAESYFGTEFANRVIYKSLLFMGIQFFMFLSIVFAVYLRLPPQKRLYGFYTIHAGLVIIGIGSLITYIAGVDGALQLAPNTPNNEVTLSQDTLKISFPESGRVITHILPNTAFTKNLNEEYEGFEFGKYLPAAEKEFKWTKPKSIDPKTQHSSKYFFKNAFASQEFTLSLHSEASEFNSTLNMGPLNIHYLPEGLAECFPYQNASKVIIWNGDENYCFTPEQRNIPIKETSQKNRFFAFKENGQVWAFFPDISPWPYDSEMKMTENTKWRVLSKKFFEESPNLFLFGPKAAFFNKETKMWEVHSFNGKAPITLPWMKAQIQLEEHQTELIPSFDPISAWPIQKNGSLIKGALKALELRVKGQQYFINNERPLVLEVDGKKVQFEITKETIKLPFSLTLTQFKMDKDPGTNMPASYESFVQLLTENGPQSHHIYMNNPMKFMGFTFYQASYFQDDNGNYHSTLSVNVDQGRPFKYLGSLMLVFGAIWHYQLNFRKKKKSENNV